MIFDLICDCIWPIFTCMFCLWLYLPTYRGALFIHQIGQPFIEQYYQLIAKIVGKYIGFVGVPNRGQEQEEAPLKDNNEETQKAE